MILIHTITFHLLQTPPSYLVFFQTGRSLGQKLAAILGINFHQQVGKLVLLHHRACFIQFSHLLCWFLYKVAVINKLLCSTPEGRCIPAQDEKKYGFQRSLKSNHNT